MSKKTRKAAFFGGSNIQEIPVVGSLEEIEANGLYSVPGFDSPVSVEAVTSYGEEQLSEEHPGMVFFTGADGERRYAIETGEFAD